MKNLVQFSILFLAGFPTLSYAGDISVVNYTGRTVTYIASFYENFSNPTTVTVENCVYVRASRCDGYGMIDSKGKPIYIKFANLAKYNAETKIYKIDVGQQLKFDNNNGPGNIVGIDLFNSN